jgi:Fanconi-associated nuclease 1
LPRASQNGPRPLWGEPPLTVEEAVARAVGRPVIQAENLLWTTLYGLVCFDLFWMPVPGMLPRPHLAGPLDLGSPDFAKRRQHALDERLGQVVAGEAPALLKKAWVHHGERVRGIAWDRWPLEVLAACATGVGGSALAVILRRLAIEGWAAATGLPDLVILQGPAIEVNNAYPARLSSGLLLAEVKGPGDVVRDAQAVWFDRLLRGGAQVELWRVVEGAGR